MEARDCVLTVNRGSSSLKFALYASEPLELLASGRVERMGSPDAALIVDEGEFSANAGASMGLAAGDAVDGLMGWIERAIGADRVMAVGHRVVHGGPRYQQSALINQEMIAELKRISPFDPQHLPAEISLIEDFARLRPRLPQVACFDTEFHRDLPRVARMLPIPRKYEEQGVRRYGFHGLSYQYLMQTLGERIGQQKAKGRIVLAHLGAGASLAAVKDGRCVDTSMAFTPTAGIPMATRTGDLDPGLVSYLASTSGMTVDEFHHLVNHESGLLGVSETSGDVRDLLAKEKSDERAAEALALFCYSIKKWIGAYAAALGGLDLLVFAGGIGENSPVIRRRICERLEFLGIEIDDSRNEAREEVISTRSARVGVHVIATNEQLMIARATRRVVSGGIKQ